MGEPLIILATTTVGILLHIVIFLYVVSSIILDVDHDHEMETDKKLLLVIFLCLYLLEKFLLNLNAIPIFLLYSIAFAVFICIFRKRIWETFKEMAGVVKYLFKNKQSEWED